MVDRSELAEFVRDASDAAVSAGEFAQSLPGIRGAYSAFCRIAAGTPATGALAAVNLPTVCQPYLDELGRTFGEQGPPIPGGQCPTTRYELNYSYRWVFPGEPESTIENNVQRFSTGPFQPYSGPSLTGDPNRTVWGFVGTSVQGSQINGTVLSPNDLDPNRIGRLKILSGPTIEAVDGPDDCGDTEQPFLPGEGWQGEQFGDQLTYDDPNGGSYDITVGPPSEGPGGGLSIPVTIDGVEVNLGGGGGDGGGGVLTPGPTSSGPPVSTGGNNGPEPVPEDPNGAPCIALSVVLAGVPMFLGEVLDSSPVRRTFDAIGNAAIKLTTADNDSYWGEDVILRNTRTVLAIPVEGLEITEFRLVLPLGVQANVTPIYRSEE